MAHGNNGHEGGNGGSANFVTEHIGEDGVRRTTVVRLTGYTPAAAEARAQEIFAASSNGNGATGTNHNGHNGNGHSTQQDMDTLAVLAEGQGTNGDSANRQEASGNGYVGYPGVEHLVDTAGARTDENGTSDGMHPSLAVLAEAHSGTDNASATTESDPEADIARLFGVQPADFKGAGTAIKRPTTSPSDLSGDALTILREQSARYADDGIDFDPKDPKVVADQTARLNRAAVEARRREQAASAVAPTAVAQVIALPAPTQRQEKRGLGRLFGRR